MPLLEREQAMEAVREKNAAYRKALADVEFTRDELHAALRDAYAVATNKPTIRDLALEVGLTFGRVGQIVRGEP